MLTNIRLSWNFFRKVIILYVTKKQHQYLISSFQKKSCCKLVNKKNILQVILKTTAKAIGINDIFVDASVASTMISTFAIELQ